MDSDASAETRPASAAELTSTTPPASASIRPLVEASMPAPEDKSMLPTDCTPVLPVTVSTPAAKPAVNEPPTSMPTASPTFTTTSSPALMAIDSAARPTRPAAETVTSSADWKLTSPVIVMSVFRVRTDSDSVASKKARPVTRVALSPAKPVIATPASMSMSSVDRDTEPPE